MLLGPGTYNRLQVPRMIGFVPVRDRMGTCSVQNVYATAQASRPCWLTTPARACCVRRGLFILCRAPSSRRKAVYMAKQEGIEMEGLVTDVLPDRKYRVQLDNGHMVLAYGAGKMSKFKIKVLTGDRVTLELSPYDLSRGRITYRHK